MISHSPPIFSHSPPVSFLPDYMNNNHHRSQHHHAPFRAEVNGIQCRSQCQMSLASRAMVNNVVGNATARQRMYRNGRNCLERVLSAPTLHVPPKSCLIRRPHMANSNDTTGDITEEPQLEESRSRKRVIFADDEGFSLTEVRVMSEPSNVPPYWSIKFLEQITQGLVSPQPADQWTVDFKQPASDYLWFRQKIERDFVSLENVIIKDEESIVVGTIKVKNIAFEKEVIVRATWDEWLSQQDIFCTFNKAYGLATSAHVIFDTFSFKITLPPSSKRLEFCICFRANGQEYWDNNNDKNYTISKRSPFYYNALSPYDKTNNSSNCNRNSCPSHLKISALTEALANCNQSYESQCGVKNNTGSSPYW